MARFGVGSGSRRAKPERARRFEQADRLVVEAFADLHETRRLKRNQFRTMSPGALQRFERQAWKSTNRSFDQVATSQRRLNSHARPSGRPAGESLFCLAY
jgi:hypothetical protein